MRRWEIGSEFDWSDRYLSTSTEQRSFPPAYQLFATGTGCLCALKQAGGLRSVRRRIHLPSYYCMAVASRLSLDFEICWYRDLPTNATPDWGSIHAASGDLILVCNTFGIRTSGPWQNWLHDHPDVVIIEDHSHDPFSEWARTSDADFAFASLRKTLPLPDGGMLYSPKGYKLPIPSDQNGQAADERLTAMLLKHAFLGGLPIEKSTYRELELKSQRKLADHPRATASRFTQAMLGRLDIEGMRRRKRHNICHFLQKAAENPQDAWKPFFSALPEGQQIPLNVIVECPSRELRERLRQHLIRNHVFPAIHWPMESEIHSADREEVRIADRILTIPIDFRYSIEDVDRVFVLMQQC